MKPKTNGTPQITLPPKAPKAPAVNEAEEAIDRAVQRVYKIYGGDLSVFFKAAQERLNLERHEKQKQ